ncbi:hypothetical protein QUF58_01935 [Anaerolineales bacterium HSG24]|nr:hypothetical protein [Anaerolineales bacterium HSG24]
MNTPLEEQAWLVGFSINPTADGPDLYTLIFPGEVDEPLSKDGYLLFFSNPNSAPQFLNSSCELNRSCQLTGEVDAVYDIAMMLDMLARKDTDTTATIVDGLNILFDLVKASNLSIPPDYQQTLYSLADHTTFNREFASFLTKQAIPRNTVIDGVLWCLGAIVSKAKIVG